MRFSPGSSLNTLIAVIMLTMLSCFDYKDTDAEKKEQKALLSILNEAGFDLSKLMGAGLSSNLPALRRKAHVTLVFQDKMWVLGGHVPGGAWDFEAVNDVWWSQDGVNWTCAVRKAPWGPRLAHAGVVFDNRMWIMGGTYVKNSCACQMYCHDVWYSSDGVNWTLAGNAPWEHRSDLSAVVHNGKIYVIGGNNGPMTYFSDVWSSADGIHWTREMNDGFPHDHDTKRTDICAAAVESYNGKIWVMGGESYEGRAGSIAMPRFKYGQWRSAWTSPDGALWTDSFNPDNSKTWTFRAAAGAAVFNDRLWISGGRADEGYRYGVWYMDDSAGDYQAPWVCTNESLTSMPGVYYHSFVSYRGSLWIFLGYYSRLTKNPPDQYGQVYYSETRGYMVDAYRSEDGYVWKKMEIIEPSTYNYYDRNNGKRWQYRWVDVN